MCFICDHLEKLTDRALLFLISLTADNHILRLAKSNIRAFAGKYISVRDEKVSVVTCFECTRVKLTEHLRRVYCVSFKCLIGVIDWSER